MINRRAACYYVGFVKNQNKAAKNALSGQYNEMNLGKMRSAVAKTTRILNLPEYQNSIKEWKRTKKKLNISYDPNWDSLFDGPKNFKECIGIGVSI
ncbi:hypothetical protein [Brevibacillus laterosporus]|uniref:hypothetical protein n=1 Tax=Brevibacillus laterosporus TaxID=1465 RepID=UPI0003B21C43|nr:hypothetical protein [Brevibacillus laterosporus]ERM17724.1 hypothetical protein P615_19135 [Brevibacillus laterosporus PE36]